MELLLPATVLFELVDVGSPIQNAINDAMNDLFTDTSGGIVGAAIGVLIRRNEKKCGHWKVADEVEELIN